MMMSKPNPENTIVVNVFDLWDPRKAKSMKIVKDGAAIPLGGMSNGVGQMVTEITRLVSNPPKKVRLLRIFSHGGEGVMAVSMGNGADPGYKPENRASIDVNNFSLIKADLAKLKDHFSANALVELHGCSVGGGTPGDKLLQSLADLWGVRVKAGTMVQFSGNAGNQVKFEGPTKTASPGGKAPASNGESMSAEQITYYVAKEIQSWFAD
ncbi:MAG: DUF4347 domain-containing protein [Pseudomonadota bacterium]